MSDLADVVNPTGHVLLCVGSQVKHSLWSLDIKHILVVRLATLERQTSVNLYWLLLFKVQR